MLPLLFVHSSHSPRHSSNACKFTRVRLLDWSSSSSCLLRSTSVDVVSSADLALAVQSVAVSDLVEATGSAGSAGVTGVTLDCLRACACVRAFAERFILLFAAKCAKKLD